MKDKYRKPEYWRWFRENWDAIKLFHIQMGNNPFDIKFDPITYKQYLELKNRVENYDQKR